MLVRCSKLAQRQESGRANDADESVQAESDLRHSARVRLPSRPRPFHRNRILWRAVLRGDSLLPEAPFGRQSTWLARGIVTSASWLGTTLYGARRSRTPPSTFRTDSGACP